MLCRCCFAAHDVDWGMMGVGRHDTLMRLCNMMQGCTMPVALPLTQESLSADAQPDTHSAAAADAC